MTFAAMADVIRGKLAAGLHPVHLEIIDESLLHAGHAGAVAGGGHYRVTVVAPAFDGLEQLARHRLVYRLLGSEMKSGIHALALRTLTPAEWAG